MPGTLKVSQSSELYFVAYIQETYSCNFSYRFPCSTELDFRFPVGAPLHGIQAFLRTNQLKVNS
jgi:hypothetical protein